MWVDREGVSEYAHLQTFENQNKSVTIRQNQHRFSSFTYIHNCGQGHNDGHKPTNRSSTTVAKRKSLHKYIN